MKRIAHRKDGVKIKKDFYFYKHRGRYYDCIVMEINKDETVNMQLSNNKWLYNIDPNTLIIPTHTPADLKYTISSADFGIGSIRIN